MTRNGTPSSTPTAPHPRSFRDLAWTLPHGVRVQTHNYDNTLCAFEVTQHKTCLGTLIPSNIGDMERLKYVLDHNLSIDGFECNDGFGTVIEIDTQENDDSYWLV